MHTYIHTDTHTYIHTLYTYINGSTYSCTVVITMVDGRLEQGCVEFETTTPSVQLSATAIGRRLGQGCVKLETPNLGYNVE